MQHRKTLWGVEGQQVAVCCSTFMREKHGANLLFSSSLYLVVLPCIRVVSYSSSLFILLFSFLSFFDCTFLSRGPQKLLFPTKVGVSSRYILPPLHPPKPHLWNYTGLCCCIMWCCIMWWTAKGVGGGGNHGFGRRQ